jgi:hypothetical protein
VKGADQIVDSKASPPSSVLVSAFGIDSEEAA